MKTRIVRWIIRWLACRYLTDINTILNEMGQHVHANPKRREV